MKSISRLGADWVLHLVVRIASIPEEVPFLRAIILPKRLLRVAMLAWCNDGWQRGKMFGLEIAEFLLLLIAQRVLNFLCFGFELLEAAFDANRLRKTL